MSIIGLPAFKDNYIWGIVNEKKRSLTCIDPGVAAPVLSYLKNNALSLDAILITHHHADHADGVLELLQSYPKTKVYGVQDSRLPFVNHVVCDADRVHVDSNAFRVLNTPGHTSTHICYHEPTQGWLFCGDTLFSAGCGRVFDGTMEALYHSIMLLKRLPDDTKVYCGHEYTQQNLRFAASVDPENSDVRDYYHHLNEQKIRCSLPSTIALEKKINPFMRTDSESIQAFASAHGVSSHDSFAIFSLLREKKNSFVDA